MSMFSRSSGRRSYRNPYQGSRHYQRKGLFGELLGSFMGSFSSRSGRYYQQGGYPPGNYPQGNYPPPNGYPQNSGYPQQPLQRSDTGISPTSNMFCPSCGAKVPAGSKFCLECGAKMADANTCPNCGQQMPPGAKFCPGCGTPRK